MFYVEHLSVISTGGAVFCAVAERPLYFGAAREYRDLSATQDGEAVLLRSR
jgi:hypothetical protein